MSMTYCSVCGIHVILDSESKYKTCETCHNKLSKRKKKTMCIDYVTTNDKFNEMLDDLAKCSRFCDPKYKADTLAKKYNCSRRTIFRWKKQYLINHA